ncbi:MAG: hypothetical protein HC892_00380 [Saprospiraceae bacterium]|nr:hypothetical protein [Saprospiraceae bacterium]
MKQKGLKMNNKIFAWKLGKLISVLPQNAREWAIGIGGEIIADGERQEVYDHLLAQYGHTASIQTDVANWLEENNEWHPIWCLPTWWAEEIIQEDVFWYLSNNNQTPERILKAQWEHFRPEPYPGKEAARKSLRYYPGTISQLQAAAKLRYQAVRIAHGDVRIMQTQYADRADYTVLAKFETYEAAEAWVSLSYSRRVKYLPGAKAVIDRETQEWLNDDVSQ